jgi:hypothetical protein
MPPITFFLEGSAADDPDGTESSVAPAVLNHRVMPGPVDKDRWEDLQAWGFLQACALNGHFKGHPMGLRRGTDPPDRILSYGDQEFGLELTQLTVGSLRQRLADVRRVGRRAAERWHKWCPRGRGGAAEGGAGVLRRLATEGGLPPRMSSNAAAPGCRSRRTTAGHRDTVGTPTGPRPDIADLFGGSGTPHTRWYRVQAWQNTFRGNEKRQVRARGSLEPGVRQGRAGRRGDRGLAVGSGAWSPRPLSAGSDGCHGSTCVRAAL